MKKLKTPTAVTTAVLTLITIFFWIAFEVYRSLTVKPTPPVPPEIIIALNPTLDSAALNKLQQRMHLSDTEIGNNTIPTSTPVATSAPITESTVSATPAASESATPSASPSASPTVSPSPTP